MDDVDQEKQKATCVQVLFDSSDEHHEEIFLLTFLSSCLRIEELPEVVVGKSGEIASEFVKIAEQIWSFSSDIADLIQMGQEESGYAISFEQVLFVRVENNSPLRPVLLHLFTYHDYLFWSRLQLGANRMFSR